MKAWMGALVAALVVGACAGSAGMPGVDGEPGRTPSPETSLEQVQDKLPESGVLARVVNLFADESGPHDLDVYGFGGNLVVSPEVLVGAVAYGTASDWFDPGFVEGSEGRRTSNIAVHLAGGSKQIAGISSADAVAGSAMTVIVTSGDGFGARMRSAFDHHPDAGRADVPVPIADKGVLVTSHEGLAEDDVFYASVGDFCLPGRFPDPQIEELIGRPVPQPIGNDLVVDPGAHSLTIHRDDAASGEIAACKNERVAQAPLDIDAGKRAYVLLYTAPGASELKVLVLPFRE